MKGSLAVYYNTLTYLSPKTEGHRAYNACGKKPDVGTSTQALRYTSDYP